MLSRLSDETFNFLLRRASTQPRSVPGSQRAVPCAASSTPDSVPGFVPLLASLAGQSGIVSFYLANILGQFALILIWFIYFSLNLVYISFLVGNFNWAQLFHSRYICNPAITDYNVPEE